MHMHDHARPVLHQRPNICHSDTLTPGGVLLDTHRHMHSHVPDTCHSGTLTLGGVLLGGQARAVDHRADAHAGQASLVAYARSNVQLRLGRLCAAWCMGGPNFSPGG